MRAPRTRQPRAGDADGAVDGGNNVINTSMMPFQFRQHEVRVFMALDGEPNWIAKDVCNVLSINRHRDALARLDEDQKGRRVKVDSPGGTQMMATLLESGLYDLILRSRKPEATPFRKWVTSDVLPQIRKTGGYGKTQPPEGYMLVKTEQYVGLLLEVNTMKDEKITRLTTPKTKILPISDEERDQIRTLFAQGVSKRRIARETGRSARSVGRVLKNHR